MSSIMICNSTIRAASSPCRSVRSASARSPHALRPLHHVPRLDDGQQCLTDELDRPMDAGTVLRLGVTGQFEFQKPVHAVQQGVGVVLHVTAINHPPAASS